jgi:hypothetical protein
MTDTAAQWRRLPTTRNCLVDPNINWRLNLRPKSTASRDMMVVVCRFCICHAGRIDYDCSRRRIYDWRQSLGHILDACGGANSRRHARIGGGRQIDPERPEVECFHAARKYQGLCHSEIDSPDFNPIERTFAKLKARLRKAAERTTEELGTLSENSSISSTRKSAKTSSPQQDAMHIDGGLL